MNTVKQADPYGRGSYCIVVALTGTNSTTSRNLRAFRDNVLKQLPLGRQSVDLYYRTSPVLVRLAERSSLASRTLNFGIGTVSKMFSVFSGLHP